MSKTFSSETFKKTFDAYVRNWHISEAVLLILAFLPFLAYGIAKYLEFSWIPILSDITFGAISSGIVSFGAVSFGVVSIGAGFFWCDCYWHRILRDHHDRCNIHGGFRFWKCRCRWIYRHFYRFHWGNPTGRWQCFWNYSDRAAGKRTLRAFL